MSFNFSPIIGELYCLFMRGFGAFSVTVDLLCSRAQLGRFAVLNLIC